MSDLTRPVLPGTAATDYERYLRTDELLALQRPEDERVNDDELAFQIVHQSSELWLKLACADVERAMRYITGGPLTDAARRLRRANDCMAIVTAQTHMIEHMAPWDYHTIRRGLGHGSGFDSPGFRRVHHITPLAGEAFEALIAAREIDLLTLYQHRLDYPDVYEIAELLVTWDERVNAWKFHHLRIVERIIGGHVIGTQGTPVEVLGKRIDTMYFPALWDVRNQLTGLRKLEEAQGETPGHGR